MPETPTDVKTYEEFWDTLWENRERGKCLYLVGHNSKNRVAFAVAYKDGHATTFPLGWKTAAFIGYCLIQEAVYEAGIKKVMQYLHLLAARRKDIAVWLLECTEWFQKKDEAVNNGKEQQ